MTSEQLRGLQACYLGPHAVYSNGHAVLLMNE